MSKGQVSELSQHNPPEPSEFRAGDMAVVRWVDQNGFQGRDPHPPVDLQGEAVVILAPRFVIDAETGAEYLYGSSHVIYGEGIWLTDVNQPLWIYDTICVSGPHKGQHYEMMDGEMVRAFGRLPGEIVS